MKAISTEKTLKKAGSDFKNWDRSYDTMVLENACPKCHSDIPCVYADMGGTDFNDTYSHICMNSECSFIEKKEYFDI